MIDTGEADLFKSCQKIKKTIRQDRQDQPDK